MHSGDARTRRNDNLLGALIAVAAFAIYLSTLAPSVLWEDGGELAAAIATLGITHPTGYPLYTMLGWAFSHLPLGGTVIWKLNLLSALLAGIAVFLFFRLFLFLLSEAGRSGWTRKPASAPRREGKRSGAGEGRFADRLAAATAALVLAFSAIVWQTAVAVEVYAFHLVFLALVTGLFLRALAARARAAEPEADRAWRLFALALGLSFSNHMMTVLLAPAFLYLYFATHGSGRAARIKIARAAPPFVLGLTPYLYLPLRAARDPLMNWGDPATVSGFWRHVSGQQYRFNMFSSLEVAKAKFLQFFADLPAAFGYAPLLLALFGIWRLYNGDRRMLAFTLLLFAGCLFYAVNYNFDDPNFYLNAHAAVALLILSGIRGALKRVRTAPRRLAAAAACAGLVLCPLAANRDAADMSGQYAVEDYVKNILSPLEKDAILIVEQEMFTLPAYYFQWIEGIRPDVAVINLPLLSGAYSWYLSQLERQHPDLIRGVAAEAAAFEELTRKFARGAETAADSAVYSERYWNLIGAVVRRYHRSRAVHATFEVIPPLLEKLQGSGPPLVRIVPDGLSCRLFPFDTVPAFTPREPSFRPMPGENRHINHIRNNYAAAYVNGGVYRATISGDVAGGISFLRKAVAIQPRSAEARQWLERLGELPGRESGPDPR